MTKSSTCPEELGGLASQVTIDYGQLAQQGRLAAYTAEPEEVNKPVLETNCNATLYQEEGAGTKWPPWLGSNIVELFILSDDVVWIVNETG